LNGRQEIKGLVDNRKHRSLLQFIDKIVSVPVNYSKEDLLAFRRAAQRDYPGVVPLIDEYIRLTGKAETDVAPRLSPKSRAGKTAQPSPGEMHLFDLLREKRLFPSNADLSQFAARVLPNMTARRFDKMSRGDIAGRIIEYLETLDPGTREQLEASMREVMRSPAERTADRKSFFSTWEKIIKGIEF
jgi:hypothetical protein